MHALQVPAASAAASRWHLSPAVQQVVAEVQPNWRLATHCADGGLRQGGK